MARIQHNDAIAGMFNVNDGGADLVYVDPPFFTNKNHGDFDDRFDSIDQYVSFLAPVVYESYRVLRPGGTFILHLDWHAVHYAKVLCDQFFGYDAFVNEIIWNYASGGASTKRLSRKHDNLLYYVKPGGIPTFNTMREPYATPDTEGRPGFHPEGRVLTDVWNIPIMSTTSNERTGYATQKPLKLMDRIIELFTNPGDSVLDPMCGSGTTGVAACRAGRWAWCIDKNPEAIAIAKPRVMAAQAEWACGS